MRGLIQLFGQLLTPAARRFHQALAAPELAQRRVHQAICDRLVMSEYGKALGIRSRADWQQLPIVSYDELEPWILRAGLTPEPILFCEKTSGSGGAVKRIPYTRSLRRSFNHMFCVWAHDLIQNGPRFSTGVLYACISPQLSTIDGSEKPGLQDDSDYLDAWLRWLLRPFLVMPKGLPQLRDAQLFQHQLCLALVQAERLETISIWSPSFLQVHLNYIQDHRSRLQQELQHRISPNRLQCLIEPDIVWTQLWPHLKLISCWDSAQAADQADGLRSQFPEVLVQGKGLLATEAPITIPLIAAQGYVPVLDEVFLEFEDDAGCLHGLHELNLAQSYNLILSQKGGLYRYRLGDRVRVTHGYLNTPCLAFLGRSPAVSDLVGEKLHAGFVQQVLNHLNLSATHFQSLVPVAHPPHYVLLLDQATETADEIAHQLDQELSQSHHYHCARLLGQLTPPQVLIGHQIPERLTLHRVQAGSVWGGIKHSTLATSPIEATLLQELQALSTLGKRD
ncbi:MAG: GH3 auxin-responsive promoter family protein [Scytolyngbya sp. HA4215-MV1]|nr:GH3 auxin-responsive promoter family protein [Scytolyngbya sp. HA4215-MV1]